MTNQSTDATQSDDEPDDDLVEDEIGEELGETDAADTVEDMGDSAERPPGKFRRRRRKKKPRLRLSDLLNKIVNDESRPAITIGDLLREMDGRAFGALMLIFAFPNVLPAPPGLAAFLGLPLIYLSSQMMLGRMPWLPPFIDNRSLTRENFKSLIDRANPVLKRAEKLMRQRLSFLTAPVSEKLLGGLCLLLSLVLILPIPFGNMLPALAICVLALGFLERDGVWILAGLAVSAIAFVWVGGLAYALIKSTLFLVLNAF
jgi:hypothetical protein